MFLDSLVVLVTCCCGRTENRKRWSVASATETQRPETKEKCSTTLVRTPPTLLLFGNLNDMQNLTMTINDKGEDGRRRRNMLDRLLLWRNNMLLWGNERRKERFSCAGEVIHPVPCTLVSHVHFPNVGPMHFAILLMRNRWS